MYKIFVLLNIIILLFYGVFVSADQDLIKIHFICHSHCDAGWLKTFEGYYTQDVNTILTHVVDAVSKNEKRRFVWSEMGFLERWWNSTTSDYRDRFTKMIKEKRIEIINGGWVMNDEANPTVDAVIRHLADGHRFITDHFGEEFLPRSGWQIDPFGHSTLSAYIQAQMGYKHIVLDRIHYKIKKQMGNNKDLQFLWRGSPDTVGAKSDILAHTLDDFYFSPEKLYFEPPGNIEYYNLERNIPDIITYANNKTAYFKSPHILFPMGGDFFFKKAESWMDRIDLIVQRFEEMYNQKKTNVKVVYSTLEQFFAETLEWHQKNNVPMNYHDYDFFPYADKVDHYWTGYYTSRPKLKGDSRTISSKLRSAEIYHSLQQKEDFGWAIKDASKNCSILQHHDAITGTARQPVVQDYFSRLYHANGGLDHLTQTSISHYVNKLAGSEIYLKAEDNSTVLDFETIGAVINGKKSVPILLTNSLNWQRNDVFSIRLDLPKNTDGASLTKCPFTLKDKDSKDALPFDCTYRDEIFLDSPGKPKKQFIQLDFYCEIPAFGGKSFIVSKEDSQESWVPSVNRVDKNTVMSTNEITLLIGDNSLISSLKMMESGKEFKVGQTLQEYSDNGGAYLFRSHSPPKPITINNSVYSASFYNGKLVKEAFVKFSDNEMVRYRIYESPSKDLNKKIHFNFIIGGKDDVQSVMLFQTDLKNKYLYSDNGLELLKRQVPNTKDEPHTNYYPSVQLSMITDDASKDTLVCAGDRSRGVASLVMGELEFALHRSLIADDDKGLVEPARDYQPVNIRTTCYFDTLSNVLKNSRRDALMVEHPLRPMLIARYKSHIQFSGLHHELPENIHILSIEKKSKSSLILRVVNIREMGSPTTFDIRNLLSEYPSASITREYDLTNIRLYNNNDISHILHSNTSIIDGTQKSISTHPPRYTPILSKTVVTLLPLEIKSFEITSNTL
ncbi:alpha-mannosidase [Tieghemostelium lacteum]|uniref:alpha-mannosidase n=1 Tax=Tieghemostelium lacteum TaxID=361077 RepID=A0A151ZCC4_TIELA|nr:alpha-mannosidase [Tieghemostelium lacteum]|eukprot:KYQ91603.1 alpha-mannosidase [Tieghemostelium lacteum]